MKIYLYFIGKPKDPHTNAVAEDFLGRAARFSPAAMREIRKNPRWAGLPIIAMTAQALRGDHEKCIAAGASDYIAKPIDVNRLLSLIRVWVFQGTD